VRTAEPDELAAALAEVRLLAVDLDGTALDSAGELRPRTLSAWHAAESRGVLIATLTGRPVAEALTLTAALGLHGPLAASNGAAIVDRVHLNRVERVGIEHSAAQAAIARLRAREPQVRLGVVHDDVSGLDPGFPGDLAVRWGWSPDGADDPVAAALERVDAGPVQKLVAWHPDGAAALDRLLDAAAGTLRVQTSDPRFVELGAPDVDKGAALARIADAYGVPLARCAAIGDMPNDLAMLARAGTALAVANAHPDVRAASDHVVPANDHDGLALVLDALGPALEPRTVSRHGSLL